MFHYMFTTRSDGEKKNIENRSTFGEVTGKSRCPVTGINDRNVISALESKNLFDHDEDDDDCDDDDDDDSHSAKQFSHHHHHHHHHIFV